MWFGRLPFFLKYVFEAYKPRFYSLTPRLFDLEAPAPNAGYLSFLNQGKDGASMLPDIPTVQGGDIEEDINRAKHAEHMQAGVAREAGTRPPSKGGGETAGEGGEKDTTASALSPMPSPTTAVRGASSTTAREASKGRGGSSGRALPSPLPAGQEQTATGTEVAPPSSKRCLFIAHMSIYGNNH